MNTNKTDEKIDEIFKKLPKDIKPKNDLWEKIEANLAERKNTNELQLNFMTKVSKYSTYITSVAALFICIIGFSFFMYNYNQKENTSQYITALKELESAAKVYHNAKTNLIKLTKANTGISEETSRIVLKNIQIIDDAVNEIKTALKNEPDNQILLSHLNNIYYEQTTLLLKTGNLLKNNTMQGGIQ